MKNHSSRLTLVGVGILALAAFAVPRLAAQADESSGTYTLSAFRIAYPYQGPEGSEPDPTVAGVSFVAAWSGSSFPGEVGCHILLLDEDGKQVGDHVFLGTYATSDAEAPTLSIAVSGVPSSATGSCELGNYKPGPGYTFSFTDITTDSEETDDSLVWFETHWASTDDPGLRDCHFVAALSDGSEYSSEFTYWAPDKTQAKVGTPVSADLMTGASVECQEISV